MTGHIRTAAYLVAAAAIWFAEDGVFSTAFGFNAIQTAVVTLYFVALLVAALWLVRRTYRAMRESGSVSDLSLSRAVAMAPVAVVLIGSFAALPIFMIVLLAGAVR